MLPSSAVQFTDYIFLAPTACSACRMNHRFTYVYDLIGSFAPQQSVLCARATPSLALSPPVIPTNRLRTRTIVSSHRELSTIQILVELRQGQNLRPSGLASAVQAR